MFRWIVLWLVAVFIHYNFRGWRLSSYSNTAPSGTSSRQDHRHLHRAVQLVPDMCGPAPLCSGSLTGLAGVLLLGCLAFLLVPGDQVQAVAPDPQYGPPPAVPRPVYKPGHRTVPPPTKPLRFRRAPDWYCCCTGQNFSPCCCDRTME